MLKLQCKKKKAREILFESVVFHTRCAHKQTFHLNSQFPEAPCSALYRSAQQSLFRQQWQILGAESSSLSLRHHSCPPPPLFLLLCPLKNCLLWSVLMQTSISLYLLPSSSCTPFQNKTPSMTWRTEVTFYLFISCDWLLARKQGHIFNILQVETLKLTAQ